MTTADPAPNTRKLGNPLATDPTLFDMYVITLKNVFATPEISSAIKELDLSLGTLRNDMTNNARRILESAEQEFAAYREAVAYEEAIAADPANISHGSQTTARTVFGWISACLGVIGAALLAAGLLTRVYWPWTQPLAWAGGATLTVAILMALAVWSLRFELIDELVRGLTTTEGSFTLVAARNQLLAAVGQTEMLAQTRILVNTARERRLGDTYAVRSSPGLSEVYDSSNRVPTDVATDLEELIGRLDGASIGVAGPRGCGKSMLVREYCEDDPPTPYPNYFDWTTALSSEPKRRSTGDLKCMVSAPVEYEARDFVLHLFATFCRAVIRSRRRRSRDVPAVVWALHWSRRALRFTISVLWRLLLYGGPTAALLHWRTDVARAVSEPVLLVQSVAVVIGLAGSYETIRSCSYEIRRWIRQARPGNEDALAKQARSHLSRVRYLQTYTSGWSGGLNLIGGAAGGQHSRSVARAEQPLSYPEIVSDFRRYASDVAAEVHRRGDRVFVGVDEVDKIGSSEQAERFLNEIKGVFGIPHLYFMVSVSDDALTAFERRGLPLRDAFDSSFDEIVQVGPLSYAESRRLLYRRVIGLTEPYVALCHCLAGGLARDLVRAARQVVRTAASLRSGGVQVSGPPPPPEGEFTSFKYSPAAFPEEEQPLRLGQVSAAVVLDEIRRKLRAARQHLGHTANPDSSALQDTLYAISMQLNPEDPIIQVVDVIAQRCDGEQGTVTSLRLELSCYAYYCATLQEVFSDALDHDRIVEATAESRGPGSFDALADARYAFTVNTALAWRLITSFRTDWALATREPIVLPRSILAAGQ